MIVAVITSVHAYSSFFSFWFFIFFFLFFFLFLTMSHFMVLFVLTLSSSIIFNIIIITIIVRTLIIHSIFTFTLIPERFMYYRKAGGNADEMVLKIKQAGTLSDALTAIEHAPGVAGTVIRAALTASRDGYTPEQVEQLVQGTVTKELISMEKFLPQLDSMVTLWMYVNADLSTIEMNRNTAKPASSFFGLIALILLSTSSSWSVTCLGQNL